MFGRPANPYDEVVAKATDEKQTEINWEIALTVWDKVNEDGETGARSCIAALQKRLTHRSANVQLFSLTLAGALVSNCGPPLHREISGKAFTSALTRLVNDRSTHETVKKEALKQIETWVKEHQGNSDFDLMADTYEALKRQGHAFQPVRPPTPKGPSDDILRREEEELQRALAESAALADPVRNVSSPATSTTRTPPEPARNLPSHARAMYDFAGESSDELSFARGELIRVIDAVSDEWWRGELRGRTGIFPTNYVEPASAPSTVSSEAPRSAAGPSAEEMEGEVFSQAAAIDRLLSLMHTLRARGEDFADNEELTDLYNSSMALRPKVVQLIRRYDQKQAELRAMNDKVEQAKATFERNAALARQHQQQAHAAQYQQQPPYQQQPNGYGASSAEQWGQPPLDAYGRQFSPAPNPAAAGYASPASAPMVQTPAPAGQPMQIPADAAREEELKREYERQLVEYQRQLEEYNRQVAAIQAQQQAAAGSPQGGQAPPPSAATPVGGDQGSPPNVMTASHPPAGPPADAQPAPHAGQPQGQPQPVWDAQTNQWVWPHLQANVSAPPATSPLNAPGQPSPYPPAQQVAAQPVPVEQMANLSVTSSPPPMQPAAAAPYAQQQSYPTGATSPPPPPPASSGPQGPHPATSPGLAHAAPSYAGYPGAPSPAQPYQYSQPGYAQPYPSQSA